MVIENRTTNLHLFDVETVDESLVGEGIDFDKEDIAKNLTLFLYPDDSDDKGRILRVYQQYFMVSNAARLIIDETLARGGDLHKLNEYADPDQRYTPKYGDSGNDPSVDGARHLNG